MEKSKPIALVKYLIVKNGKAIGVARANGDEYCFDIIVSNLDVKRTFLKVVDRSPLPDDFIIQVENFKIRGSSGKLNISLDGVPIFPALSKDSNATMGDMHITDSMERAYDDWKDCKWSKDPYVDYVDSYPNGPNHDARW